MKLRTVFVANAIVAFIFGIAAILFPNETVGAYGGALDDVGVVLTRIIGGCMIGYAAITWLIRGAPTSETRRGVVLGLMISFFVMTIIYIIGALGPAGTPQDWINVFIAVVFGLAYGYFAFIKPEAD